VYLVNTVLLYDDSTCYLLFMLQEPGATKETPEQSTPIPVSTSICIVYVYTLLDYTG